MSNDKVKIFSKDMKKIENLIRAIFAREIESKILDREIDGFIIDKKSILEILEELTDVEDESGDRVGETNGVDANEERDNLQDN